MKLIIAIDPGASGGIAWRTGDGETRVISIPETRRDCIDLLREIYEKWSSNCVAYIEKISPYIPGGGATAMFHFGANVERMGCIIETLGIRLIEVPPKKWQQHFGLGKSDRISATKDMDKAQKKRVTAHNAKAKGAWKNKLKAEAQRRYPGIKVTLKTCDALLILDYAIAAESKTP